MTSPLRLLPGIVILSMMFLRCAALAEDFEPVVLDPSAGQPPPVVAPIETDRPDFTETPVAVPKGSLQVENGAVWEKIEDTRAIHLPESLFRVGIRKGTELRFVAPEYLRLRGEETANNFIDTAVGFKQELGTLPGKIQLALMPMLSLPTGANKVSLNAVESSLTLLWARDIGRKTEVGGNLELVMGSGDRGFTTGFVPTFVISSSFTEKWGGLVEYRGIYDDKGFAANMLHYAMTYKVTPRQQLDVRFGHALSGETPSLLFGVGYSFRVDHLF